MKKHEKHKNLVRTQTGQFGQSEISLVGTSCSIINEVSEEWKSELQKSWIISIVDADHNKNDLEFNLGVKEKRIEYSNNLFQSEIEQKIFNRGVNLALVNGNHYQATNQIVFIDTKKEESLKRRLDQLTNILAIVLIDQKEPFEFINDHLEKLALKEIPIFDFQNRLELVKWIDDFVNSSTPPIQALVLAGGESKRMGSDKSQLVFHGQSQEVHLARMCQELGLKTYISKKDSLKSKIGGIPVISDVFKGFGPFGAISSAFHVNPNVGWLVVACDLPLLSNKVLSELIANRNPAKLATCFRLVGKPFPEPLVTIYEPGVYMRFMEFLALGYSCPRKVLINIDAQIIDTTDLHSFYNANTPEDLQQIKKMLDGRKVQ